MALVTLDQLKKHLRYVHDDDDAALEMILVAAESAVLGYVDEKYHDPGAAPKSVIYAIIMLAGHYDLYRNAESEAPTNGNFFPQPVMSLLYKYRTPVIGGE